MEFKGLNKNATRMLTGFIMGTITMGCIMLGGVALLCLLAVVIFFASKEYVKILEHKGFYPSLKIILVSEAILAIIKGFEVEWAKNKNPENYEKDLYTMINIIFYGIVKRD